MSKLSDMNQQACELARALEGWQSALDDTMASAFVDVPAMGAAWRVASTSEALLATVLAYLRDGDTPAFSYDPPPYVWDESGDDEDESLFDDDSYGDLPSIGWE